MVELQVLSGRTDQYPIYVGAGTLPRLGELCVKAGLGRRALIVTDRSVASRYLDTARDSLARSGFAVEAAVVPDGEEQKSWQTAGKLLDRCVEAKLERTSFIVALGGGVIGDLAGFVASVYMRGIPFVQVPTTLLAQVDASVGGKVAVNHPGGKNLIGSFHQPALVLSDTALLDTLPDRELAAGMAEVVKHGLIRDPELYAFVSEAPERFRSRDPEALRRVIVDSCRIKSDIVLRDEKEQGERAVLNFGHTIGHAVEAAAGYGRYTHGEAVAIGMVTEALLSTKVGRVTAEDIAKLVRVLEDLGLPTRPEPGVVAHAGEYLMRDKKVREGKLRMALLVRIGWAEVTDQIGPETALLALERVTAGDYAL